MTIPRLVTGKVLIFYSGALVNLSSTIGALRTTKCCAPKAFRTDNIAASRATVEVDSANEPTTLCPTQSASKFSHESFPLS